MGKIFSILTLNFYEYISDDNKDINTSLNETKNKQSVELNSKLGL